MRLFEHKRFWTMRSSYGNAEVDMMYSRCQVFQTQGETGNIRQSDKKEAIREIVLHQIIK